MPEGQPNQNPIKEEGPEEIPTLESVVSIFSKLIDAPHKEMRRLEDEKGLYFLEINMPGEKEGEVTEYAYRRKGKFELFDGVKTSIEVTYYNADGIPEGGTTLATYIDGGWNII